VRNLREAPCISVVRAHAFEVIDAAGAVRVEVKPGEMRFFDGPGVPRVALGIDSEYALLLLRGRSGTIGLDTLSRSGMPGISLLDSAGKVRMAMELVGEGSAIFSSRYARGGPRYPERISRRSASEPSGCPRLWTGLRQQRHGHTDDGRNSAYFRRLDTDVRQ
jgi:hypothetical protein